MSDDILSEASALSSKNADYTFRSKASVPGAPSGAEPAKDADQSEIARSYFVYALEKSVSALTSQK